MAAAARRFPTARARVAALRWWAAMESVAAADIGWLAAVALG